jgi:hypothetical protein
LKAAGSSGTNPTLSANYTSGVTAWPLHDQSPQHAERELRGEPYWRCDGWRV